MPRPLSSGPEGLATHPGADLPPEAEAIVDAIGARARAAARVLAQAPTRTKVAALTQMADAIARDADAVLAANAADREAAGATLSPALLDRLTLTPARVAAMVESLRSVAALPDPVGSVLATWTRPNGLRFERVRVPLGVIGIIYESRPNVTADAGGLCVMSGNAAILRGGSESQRSSAAIVACLRAGLAAAGLPEAAIQGMPSSDRALVGALLRAARWVDVIVPRGGRSLVARVQAEARVPVLAHLDGNCHTYLHAGADPAMAVAVTLNAKMRRTGVCGATETLLVDAVAGERLGLPVLRALAAAGCEIRGCVRTCALFPQATPATEADWDTEFLAPILAVKLVDGLDDALTHIARHGSHHTDAIVTHDEGAAARFLAEVDSGIVLHNVSTQFADGAEFGFGAEIGIATGKLHARGPVGVEQLCSYNTRIHGNGQLRP